jgi:hypothetical protein
VAATLALAAGLAGSVQAAVMGRALTWQRGLGTLLLAAGATLTLRR